MTGATLPDVAMLFTELAAISSPPGEERPVADRVLRYLRDLRLEPQEDDAGLQIGSTMGNVFARIEGTAEGTPIFLCAHLDTVPPEGPIEPVVTDGVIRNAAATILGADNKAAAAAMLDGARRLLAENRPHAGLYPEEGRSAIAAAAKAIADFRLGRLDDETSANVGVIEGGTAGNVIPEWCRFLAEARSHDESKLADVIREMMETVAFAATVTECDVETEVHKSFRGYRFRNDDPPVRLAAAALDACGHEPRFEVTGGGADANVFNERGVQGVNLANGVANIHTPHEEI